MRLGQLARQLKVDPSTIVKFLAKNNIIIENSPNVKIEDEPLALTIANFEKKPEPVIETIEVAKEEPATIEEKAIEPTSITEEKEEIITKTDTATEPEISGEVEQIELEEEDVTEEILINPHVPITTPEEDIEDFPFVETDGVIRVPKVKLEGIKVLGKIDLPQKKEKEVEKPVKEKVTTESTTLNKEVNSTTPDENKVHPNKQNRIKGVKPTVVKDKKHSQKQEDKPLTKLEVKALRKEKKAKEQKKRKKKEKSQQTHNSQPPKIKKKKKKTTPPPKRGFWARLLGFGKE